MGKRKQTDTWESCSPEFAAKLANDISEGIDCGETRVQLRSVLHWWSMEHCRVHAEKSLAETDLTVAKLALSIVLPMVEYRKDEPARLARELASIILDKYTNGKT